MTLEMFSPSVRESGGEPPQSKRSAQHESIGHTQSVWTAVALAPLWSTIDLQ